MVASPLKKEAPRHALFSLDADGRLILGRMYEFLRLPRRDELEWRTIGWLEALIGSDHVTYGHHQ